MLPLLPLSCSLGEFELDILQLIACRMDELFKPGPPRHATDDPDNHCLHPQHYRASLYLIVSGDSSSLRKLPGLRIFKLPKFVGFRFQLTRGERRFPRHVNRHVPSLVAVLLGITRSIDIKTRVNVLSIPHLISSIGLLYLSS